jgi:hypothetical protein
MSQTLGKKPWCSVIMLTRGESLMKAFEERKPVDVCESQISRCGNPCKSLFVSKEEVFASNENAKLGSLFSAKSKSPITVAPML